MAKILSSEFFFNKRFFESVLYLCMGIIIILIVLNAEKTSLEKIKQRGEITVLTRNTATTYYEGLDGKTGFEYDLVRLFAEQLGVELKILLPGNFNEIIPMLNGNQADLIAAGLTVTEARKGLVRFAPSHTEITQELIYKTGKKKKRPRKIEDIIGKHLEVVAGSSFEERLVELRKTHPELTWVANEEMDSDELLQMVAEEKIDYTVIDSNEFELNRRFYPELRVAFDLSEPQKLAWALRKGTNDEALYQEAETFFKNIRDDGTLTRLLERHYGYARKFKPVETTVFLRHVQNRLPLYKSMFIEAGKRYDFDWRLLAAMAYQESQWITNAVSPTGVRGIMMLTQRTAGQLNVRNRLDAQESIMGGARYMRLLMEKLPESITGQDRIWMAMASYNVGLGHLEDARKITKQQKGNPDKWLDVKERLPLLSKERWHRKTKYGYARGREPVVYVRNIRSYFDILVWSDEREQKQPEKTGRDPTSIIPKSL